MWPLHPATNSRSTSSKVEADAAALRALVGDAARELGSGVATDMDSFAHRVSGRRPYTFDDDDDDDDNDRLVAGSSGGGKKRS